MRQPTKIAILLRKNSLATLLDTGSAGWSNVKSNHSLFLTTLESPFK